MTSVEKRRSGRKSGGHRRHSDGGSTSSGGSFLDENDREVCSLTDRAFRSLCIGDEAVYNDSDLSLSSPCAQRDRQLAFSRSGQDREEGEREELKRAARENFSLKVQQYGQDWIHGRMYGGEIHRDPQWEVYGERTQGRISATFQHSIVETSQKEERLNFLSNGATELNSQQRKSNSRVSSLIKAFNSERQRDGVGMDDKIRECKDETSWDKSALMSIQRELSEFSTSYQQNFHSGHFPSSGSFSYGENNLFSSGSDVATMSHNSASSFMRSSHNKKSIFTQVNCNSNVFIHSEFSPFRVWRDHNRFPFQEGQISGFMHCSEFAKWYETPMYKEPSQMGKPQGHYADSRRPRSNLAAMISPALPRSTSTSTMLQNASATEKRCESELAGHYPHRKRSQSVGTNRLPSHRPLTTSPTIEMSRRVRDTISSVKALQQKIKMMTEQNITTEGTENQQAVFYRNENVSVGNNVVTVAPNTIGSNTSTTPFNISQLLTPTVHAHQEAVSSDLQHYATSPQPVEHPPVRAESRGATPDIRMSTYKSRATSLLFNLKDNRKRVKSTYSPTKFKAMETLEKNKQPPTHEPRDTVIDIPEFPDSEIQFSQLQDSSRTSAAMNQYRLTMSNSQPVMATTGQYAEYTLSDYQRAQMQDQMVHHSGFTGFLPENYTGNKLANGQNLHEDFALFAPYRQGTMAEVGTLGEALYTHQPATETPRLNADNNQSGEYLISKPNTEQPFNETVGRLFTKVEKCEQLKHNKHDYSNVSLQDKWRQTNSQDTEKLSMNATLSPWKQETAALMEKTRQESHQNKDREFEKAEMTESFGFCPFDNKSGLVNTNILNQPFSNDTPANTTYHGHQQSLTVKDKRVLQTYSGCNEKIELKDHYYKQDYNKDNDNECIGHQMFSSAKDKHIGMGEISQRKQYMQIPKGHEVHSLQPSEIKAQSEHNMHINSFNPDKTSAPQIAEQMTEKQFVEVKAKQVMAEHIKSHHTQAEVATVQQGAQVEQPKAEPSRLILARQNDSEKDTAEWVKSGLIKEERVKQARAEHIKEIKEETIKGEQTKQSREKQPELAREEQTKPEQTRVHKVRDEPRNITEEARAEHIKKEQGKQVKAERAETEKLKEELIKTKLAKNEQAWQMRIERAKTEQATEKGINVAQVQEMEVTTEQVKKEQTETEQSGTEKVNVKKAGAEKTKTDHVKAESFQKAKEGKALVNVNTEQSTTETSTTQDAKPKEGKAEWAKQERAKAELIKAESMQEMSAKLTAKLTATQLVKSEPDKVKQVKTELAKAKAELAKIKEKMRGEQKEKGRHAIIVKEDDTAKKENHLKQDKEVKKHQQEEVIRKGSGQASRGSDDYQHLREKYGCTNTISASKNNASVAGNLSLDDPCEIQVLSPNTVEKVNKEKLTEHSPTSRFITANKENLEEVGGFKSSEVSESQHVYNESSKESKFPTANYSLTNVNTKDNSVEKLEKYTPVKDAEVSQRRDSDWAKLLPHERKPKSAEHNVGPSKDQHFMPPKSLSHKERAMTKQEILTSKIKAHAEKEISAIKEKGCAIRDGFISKNSSKQLSGSQTVKIRQRPPSQEASKKHESTTPSNATLKPQMGSLGVQMDCVKFVSPSSSATIPVKSAATTTHNIISTTECLLQNQKQEPKPMQNKEPLMINPEEQKADHAEISGKPKDGLKDSSDINTESPNKKEEDPADSTCVKAASSKPVTTENAESKEEAYVDLAPSLNIFFGQKREPAADHNLQIMGIMVTVHERKPTVKTGQGNNSTQNHINVTENEINSSDLDKLSPSQGLELSERDISSNEVIKKSNTQETEDQAKFVRESHPENEQQAPPLEPVKNNMKMCQESTHPQQDGSTMNIKPQGETQPETLTENGTITVPAKNKVPGETQPLHHKEDIIAREGKDHNTDKTLGERTDEKRKTQKVQAASSNENFTVTTVNTGISNMSDAEMLTKHVAKQALKENMTNVDNQSNISNVDGKRAPLLEENQHDSTAPNMLNTSPSNRLVKKENTHGSHKLEYNDKQIRDNKKEDDSVHIDSIAIRVVPPVDETDNMTIVGKEDLGTLPFYGVKANKEKQVTSSSCKEKVTLSTEEQASTEKSSSDDKHVLSSVGKLSDPLKFSNQQSSNNATSENTQSENEELEKVKKCGELVGESNEQPADGDYFQVQGIIETRNEPQYNSITDRDALEGRGLPGLPHKRTAASNETHNEGKIEAFVFTVDQSKRKTIDSTTVPDEDAKRKNWEAEDKLASKQTDRSRKRWNNNENAKADQANHIRKQIENHSTLSATERQSSRNSFPARENTCLEKPEVKTKPKGKISTTPEISAIADYARLKVIVSEDREANTFQEYPPNKKEGFFPLIQTRHSRRPVFTADPQEHSVKEKSLPDKTEMSAKVNKAPKVLVFPITDKEHQRTGMFKLGEKERQDAKVNESPVDNAPQNTQHKEKNHSPKTQTIQIAEVGSQKGCQEDQTVRQPNSHSLQPATSAFVVIDSLHPTMEQMHNRKEISTQQMQDGRVKKHQDKDLQPKTDDERTEKLKEESLPTQHGEIIAKQQHMKKQLDEEQTFMSEEVKREEDMKIKHILEESRASLAEEERRATQREEERRAKEREAVAIKIKERREKQKEAERRADEERKVKQKEEDITAEQREEKVRIKEIEEKEKRTIEEQQRAAQEEQQRKAEQEKQQKRATQEEQLRIAQEEKQRIEEELKRRAAQEEQQKRAAQEELQRRAAQEQQRRAAHEEQQRRAAQEEQQRRAAQEEQQRRAAQEEQLRRAAQEEQQRRAAQEEQLRRAAQEEQQRRAAQEELQRRAAQEELQRRAAQEEKQRVAEELKRRAVQEEQQRSAAQVEQQRRVAQEEQQRRAAQEEQQRRTTQEEQQRKAEQEKQQQRAAQEEKQRRAAQDEQQKSAAREEQRRAVHEEQLRLAQDEKQRVGEELKRRTVQEELHRSAAQEDQQRRAAQDEQQRRALHEEQLRIAQEEKHRAAEEMKRRAAEEELQMKAAQREQQNRAVQEIQRRRTALIEEQQQIEQKILANIEEDKKSKPREVDKVMHISEEERVEQMEEQKRQRQKMEEWMRTQKREAEMRAVERANIIKEEKQVNERPKLHENSQEALKNEMRLEKECMLAQRENDIKANKREGEKLTADSEKVRDTRREQKRAAQVDALQYYAITSTESETKQKDRQLCSPSPSQQGNSLSENESAESHTRPYRPNASASPASSLPRSNTSSPALGAKPLMFRVKDNTFRGSSSTKSVKPRFYKSFGEDFRVGSPNDRGSEKREEEQEKIRHSAGTPVQPHTGLNRLTAISESSTFQSASSPQDHSAPIPHYRPFSRRSIAMEDDDSRSLISNMSEDVESFATSAADLADIRGLYDYERPESACSFSSDVSRSLGKPPAVPPKSEKALRRAQRLTTRRMKKELSKVGADSPSGVEKDVSTICSSSSTEVRSSNRHAMASPHFSSPVCLANAPVLGSSLPSSHTERQSSHHSFHASPHATGPISIPHSTAAVSLPGVSHYATGPASHTAAPKTVAHVPSSPTFHHANHPAPVTQYHVESSYPQGYSLTQRKVLQDPGSGQYFVVDLPVQVKKKTFIDPQTGKYIQLNVRESGKSISQPQPQQTCPQPQMQNKSQQQPFSQTFPAGKPFVLYQGYHGYPQHYQPASIKSQVPATLHQNQQPGYQVFELGQNSEGHHYSPEKTPYMDTVNDKDKTYNTIYSTHGSYESIPECDKNSQLAGSSVCENDNSAPSQYHPRDIIAMSELEDFMEMSDW